MMTEKRLKMQRQTLILAVSLLTILSVGMTAMAAQQMISLAGGESTQITCTGRRLVLTLLSDTEVMADCELNPDQVVEEEEIELADDPDSELLEIGVDLDSLAEIKADIAEGLYDRPCTEAEHDRLAWHLLVNPELKCHYDHQHGDDPNLVNDIFGPPGEWFDQPGQSISYPWQTFKAPTAYAANDDYVADQQMEATAGSCVVINPVPMATASPIFGCKSTPFSELWIWWFVTTPTALKPGFVSRRTIQIVVASFATAAG
jgi:hypothetical protein